jgi:hypothetical protein
MKVHPGMPAQPALDRRTLVRTQIVEDHILLSSPPRL